MIINESKLRNMLLDTNIVTLDDLNNFDISKKDKIQSLSDFLLSSGKIKENELKRLEAYVLGIPFIGLEKEKIDSNILSLIPEPIARKYNVVPYRKNGINLEIAVLDIDNLPAIDFIKKKTGLKIQPRMTDSESIKAVLQQYKKSLQAEFDSIIQKEVGNITRIDDKKDDEGNANDLKKKAEGTGKEIMKNLFGKKPKKDTAQH